jgi:putative hemolysin
LAGLASKKLIETISNIPSLFTLFLAEGAVIPGLSATWAVVMLVVSVMGYAIVNTAEIAIIGASRIRIRHLSAEGHRGAQALGRLRAREEHFFATIVIFQNLFVVVASTMGGLLAVDIAGGLGLLVGTILITVGIAVLGELIPKVLAAKAADSVAMVVARPVELVVFVMRPVAAVLAPIPSLVARVLFRSDAKITHTVSEAELRMLIDIGAEEGAVGEEEAELMERVFRFYDRRVNEIMVPRTEAVWLESGTSVREFYEQYDATPHSRFPVYHESADNVVGIVNIKDVLRLIAQRKVTDDTPVDELMRPAYFVPETKLLGALFVEMQEQRQQMAIIVDEYGGTAGIVTLELLLEEMVGRLTDELGQPVEEFKAIDERTVRVDGGMSVDEARDELELPIPDGDYETVAGYILDVLGHIPKVGETIDGDGYSVRVSDVQGRKIEEVVVTRLPAKPSDGAEDKKQEEPPALAP